MGPALSATAENGTWACDRCGVVARWMPTFEHTGLPAGWAPDGDQLFCLRCRRERAGESAVEAAGEEASGEERVRARKTGTVEFEILRDSERANGVIARCCGTSPAVIARARERLGVETAAPF